MARAPAGPETMLTTSPSSGSLCDRIVASGGASVAFVGLSRGPAAANSLRRAFEGLSQRGLSAGLVSVGVSDEESGGDESTASLRHRARPGTVVATTPAALRSTAAVEVLEKVDCASSVGPVVVARIEEEEDVELVGPGSGTDLARVVSCVRRHAEGPVLVEASLRRRGFAAPGVSDAIVLVAGGTLAPEDRLLPAVRYWVDLFDTTMAPAFARSLFERAEAEDRCLLVSPEGAVLDSFYWQPHDNSGSLLGRIDLGPTRAIVPRLLTDDTVVPLVKEGARADFVLRDPMRNATSPVYLKLWLRDGGTVSVVHAPRVLAVVVDPGNPEGPDLDVARARDLLADGLPSVPVHDVAEEPALELAGSAGKRSGRRGGWLRRSAAE